MAKPANGTPSHAAIHEHSTQQHKQACRRTSLTSRPIPSCPVRKRADCGTTVQMPRVRSTPNQLRSKRRARLARTRAPMSEHTHNQPASAVNQQPSTSSRRQQPAAQHSEGHSRGEPPSAPFPASSRMPLGNTCPHAPHAATSQSGRQHPVNQQTSSMPACAPSAVHAVRSSMARGDDQRPASRRAQAVSSPPRPARGRHAERLTRRSLWHRG